MSDIPLASAGPSQPIALSYVSLAGDEIPPATRENVVLLQHAADFQTSIRNLRRSGIITMLWGLLLGAVASVRFVPDWTHIGLATLGITLFVVGLWNTSKPSPLGVILDASLFFLVAAFNLLDFALSISHGRPSPPTLPVVAAFQIYWAFNRLSRYPRFATAVSMQPSAATVKWLRDLANHTAKANPKTDPAVIKFVRNTYGARRMGKARLLPEVAIFVMTTQSSFGLAGTREVLLASQDGIEIQKEKKLLLRKKYKLEIRVSEGLMKIIIPHDSLQRLKQWMQLGTAVAAPLPPLPPLAPVPADAPAT